MKKLKKRRLNIFKISILISLILVTILISAGVYIHKLYMNTAKVTIKDDNESLSITGGNEQLGVEHGIKNILFIGSDEGTVDNNGRSDSMVLITIDKDNKKIKATSFMRDTLVDIPEVGEHNLNHAYAYGGPELLVKTFNHNFGLDIRDYVKVDFKNFIKIIDKLGGVEVDIHRNEIKVTNDYIRNINVFANKTAAEIKTPGLQNLNGVQALGYSRNRYTGNDYTRTNRQRIILQAIVDKLTKVGYVDFIKYANDILQDVTTTLNISEISDIVGWSVFNKVDKLESTYFPKREESKHIVTDDYHIIVNKEELKKEVQDYIYRDNK
ncbi:transcriptional attenuator, LytR family [Clostridium cavendishii DSM 21758]|uniref:Transcriptional attenuator, LytR family n=1 Tax=Clostridium cavendishii DSM 21758 TaxID=1121302 RepID=A0A1M6Q7I6_9CLOT|nr:LCP family protein [Clostridium cavendishii]SHK16110.1 transcriptional attenuator, LytR family [Clostridium cavendishii DSM 21758]